MLSGISRNPEKSDSFSGPRLRATNWIWLAERTEGIACELAANGESGDSRLDELFSEVYRLPAHSRFADGIGDGMVDAMVVDNPFVDRSDPRQAHFLGECNRILRPGGYVVLCVNYSWWYRRLAGRLSPGGWRHLESPTSQSSSDIRTARRRLTRAGFGQVRCYLGDGDSTALKALVPASGAPLREMTRIKGPQNARKVARLLLTRAGLAPLFYRALLVFGYK